MNPAAKKNGIIPQTKPRLRFRPTHPISPPYKKKIITLPKVPARNPTHNIARGRAAPLSSLSLSLSLALDSRDCEKRGDYNHTRAMCALVHISPPSLSLSLSPPIRFFGQKGVGESSGGERGGVPLPRADCYTLHPRSRTLDFSFLSDCPRWWSRCCCCWWFSLLVRFRTHLVNPIFLLRVGILGMQDAISPERGWMRRKRYCGRNEVMFPSKSFT